MAGVLVPVDRYAGGAGEVDAANVGAVGDQVKLIPIGRSDEREHRIVLVPPGVVAEVF